MVTALLPLYNTTPPAYPHYHGAPMYTNPAYTAPNYGNNDLQQAPIYKREQLGLYSWGEGGGWGITKHEDVFIVWDTAEKKFCLGIEHFEKDNLFHRNNYTSWVSNPPEDGEIIAGNIVDQMNSRLILPNGYSVYGPTGDIFDPSGRFFKRPANPFEEIHPQESG